MKKILLLLLLFVGLFVVSGCGSKDKNPKISNPDELYVTVTENGFTYQLTNQQMYQTLKKQFGGGVLTDMIDRDILKNTPSGNSNYWDVVTQERITELLEKEAFPQGKENLSQDEIDQKMKDHLDSLFINLGLLTLNDVHNFYRLSEAKRLYAEDLIREKYLETDIKETDIEKYYDTNYRKGFYTIIVSFESEKLLTDALTQFGIKIIGGVWYKLDNTPLTEQEIVKAYIDLYNMNNSYKNENYPTSTLILNQGTQYKIVDGKISFDLDEIDMLKMSHLEIFTYQSEIYQLLDNRLKSYPDGEWYTNNPRVYRNGARYSLVMKIDEVIQSLESVRNDIRETLIKAEVTSTFINNSIIRLREENNLTFFDKDLEIEYKNNVENRGLTFKTTKKVHKTIVAKSAVAEYTADDLFTAVNYNFGMMIASNKIEVQRFTRNMILNEIYNIHTQEILDSSKWNSIKQYVQDEKENFKNNLYQEYGFPASYGWENFMRDIYGVNSEEELLEYYLFLEVKNAYQKSLGDVANLEESSELWQFYLEQMNQIVNRFFNVGGIHLLIYSTNSSGNVINPEDYTDAQKLFAKEFYEQVMTYLQAETTGTFAERLNAVVDAYNRAPRFMPGTTHETGSQVEIPGAPFTFKGIELSKFKTAGLLIKFENLGQFRNDRMVKEFDEAVRSIYLENPAGPVVYGLEPNQDDEWTYLVTQFGYHVYVNLEIIPIDKWDDENVLPTLPQIKLWLADRNTKEITDKVRSAINIHFVPIQTELQGAQNFSLQSYRQIRQLTYDFSNSQFSVEQYNKFIDLRIERIEKNLKYK